MPETQFVKTKYLSELLGVSQELVRQHCIKGKIPGAKRFGSTWLIPKSFVENYVPSEPEPKPKQVRKPPEELKILTKPTVFDEIRKRVKAK